MLKAFWKPDTSLSFLYSFFVLESLDSIMFAICDSSLFIAAAALLFGVQAQYFPPVPEGVTTLKSKFNNGITISYKEVCITTPQHFSCAF